MNSLEQALSEVGNEIYAVSGVLERMEHEDKLSRNGHHMRQEMALRAQILVYCSWPNQQEKEELSSTHPVKEALQREALSQQ